MTDQSDSSPEKNAGVLTDVYTHSSKTEEHDSELDCFEGGIEGDVTETKPQLLVSLLDAVSNARSQALHFYSTANPLLKARLLRYKRNLLARCTGRLPTRALIKLSVIFVASTICLTQFQ